ncbi:2Fe-2S iron-sulfur cluster-binding protein [Vineibacter terrae]|uniref:2Fe-2S iron-sulfur cluster-binding protein n=1 Tax=Vineibacter terrae TaxID=2586908 RepID=UPI002E32196C|nr:2Fe-2S iron-sulfur cluster-binding protein [Vineibacter terrae]HEX2886973.1 2Fe-2S iron-sulfur cluster-binding protein [Vineibacter terrae]
MTGTSATFQVTIANRGRTIACAADQTILQAAIAAGIAYPFACATGNCATCISKLDDGTVSLLPRADAALREAQVRAGLTLACRAQPRSDVTVTWLARVAD